MNKILILFMCLLIMFYSLPRTSQTAVTATNGDTVLNIDTGLTYSTIQAAINANETLNGHTILVGAKAYAEHLTVNKSLRLVGQNRGTTIISGNGTDTIVYVTSPNVVIMNFTVKNGGKGIYLDHVNNTQVKANTITDNSDGISVQYSHNCTIHQNTAGNNTNRGILISNSDNFTVSNNQVYESNMYGINANSSAYGMIIQNNVFNNFFDGIGIFDSSECLIIENNITDNYFFGIAIQNSNNINIYHNNFINNGIQANSTSMTIVWDNGYPSGGNYWSNYQGSDENGDGIGDTPYTMNVDNVDHYPLMTQYVIPEFPSLIVSLILVITTLLVLTIHKRRNLLYRF